ncbi:MAG: ThiF family adenylyltransferase [bacterium]|nr:ThiF family adenylyltransferase [bacterium]
MKIAEISIIGAGSLGSFTVQIMAKMHPAWQCPISVWDFDKVEGHNIANQLYGRGDIGHSKVTALSEIIKKLDGPDLRIIDSAVDENTDLRGLVIVAVDTMLVRKKVMDICKFNWGIDYLIEARMGGHIGKVFALDPKHPEAVSRYNQYLHDDKDAANPLCATNETIPALWIVASSIAHLVLLYQRAIFLKNNFIETTIDLTDHPIVNSDAYALI